MADRNKALDEIYYNPKDPGSFSSVDALHRRAKEEGIKITRKDLEDYLAAQDAYTLHRQIRRRYSRNPIVVGAIDKQWQADLADMSSLAEHNDGYKYLLTVIDCFSKFAWAIPLKNKSGPALLAALKTLLEKAHPRKPNRLQTDKGKEFLNKPVQEFLEKNAIKHFSSESDQKAAMVERFNRTLKSRMWKYFTAENTFRYLNVLDDLLHGYNQAKHRTIGMAPADVRVEDEESLFRRMYPHYGEASTAPRKQLKIGETVRITKSKGAFEKGYDPKWSEEIFKVSGLSRGTRRRIYKLRDRLDENIRGIFYPEEVQRATIGSRKRFTIEKILKTKKVGRGTFHLIKWRGYPDKFNSWINSKDVERK